MIGRPSLPWGISTGKSGLCRAWLPKSGVRRTGKCGGHAAAASRPRAVGQRWRPVDHSAIAHSGADGAEAKHEDHSLFVTIWDGARSCFGFLLALLHARSAADYAERGGRNRLREQKA